MKAKREIKILGDHAEIPLTQGQISKIDLCDIDKCRGKNWYAMWKGAAKTFYAATWIDGKLIYLHTFIMGVRGVDHINHDALDNRRNNLRLCNQSQNKANTRKQVGTSSKFKGIYWNKDRNKWHSQIVFQGRSIYLGLFHEEITAAKAYDAKAIELFGEFAFINFPPMSDPQEKSSIVPQNP